MRPRAWRLLFFTAGCGLRALGTVAKDNLGGPPEYSALHIGAPPQVRRVHPLGQALEEGGRLFMQRTDSSIQFLLCLTLPGCSSLFLLLLPLLIVSWFVPSLPPAIRILDSQGNTRRLLKFAQ